MVNWTPEQESAITAKGSNLLVAAAAGSGKTAVLVERIIRLITKDKVDIDRLLIVTFTNAAAGEMRERIGAALMAELEKQSENEQHLKRQLNLLSRASISTMHSFCTNVVRKYFHLIDIDPNFRIGDETETALMKLEAIEELFEAEYEKASEFFLGLVEMFGGNRDDGTLKQLVLQCYEFIQSQPYPEKWLAKRVEDFALDDEGFEESPWVRAVVEQLRIDIQGAKGIFEEALAITEKPGGPEGYKKALLDDLLTVDELVKSLDKGITSFYKRAQDLYYTRLGWVSQNADENLKELTKNLREEGKKVLNEACCVFAKSPGELLKELNTLYPYMKYLCGLVTDFGRRYSLIKSEKGVVDFDDLEHYALTILADDAVAAEYRDKFEYIFVDEYQDSNLVQETILDFIKRCDNLFLVGDVKQSIYRFRLADPTLFMEKYDTFEDREQATNRRIDLAKNFRSRKEVIDGVNFIFKHIMSKHFGEIDYDDKAKLYPGVDANEAENVILSAAKDLDKHGVSGSTGGAIEVCLIEKDPQLIETDDAIEELEDVEVEARIVVKRIKRLIGKDIYDAKLKTMRKVDYKDIVVLLRTTRNWAQSFQEVFAAEGIPSYADVNTGYFEAQEINVFLNLLAVIDNKRQDIPLLSVMRSPIFNFSVDELIDIRVASPAKTFYEAVEAYIENGENDNLRNKTADLIDRLNVWKNESRFIRIDDYIWKLLTETGYYYYVGAMPGGEQRQANLRVMLDRAKQFEASSIKGLFNFIKFIDKLKTSSGDLGTAKILGENDNVVRIMSIHKSKGLEFPVVIVAGMGKQFNLSDTNAPVLFHKDLGIGPRYVDIALRGYTDTIAKKAMRDKIKIENLSEEMRILYVAVTRPKDTLILVGSVRGLSKSAEKWAKPISPFNLAKGKNLFDWVCPVIMRHKGGEKLRELAEVNWDEDVLIPDDSKWVVEVVDRTHISKEETIKGEIRKGLEALLREFKPRTSSAAAETLLYRLDWEYPHKDAVRIPSKLSVTQIKQLKAKGIQQVGINIPPLAARPKFREGKKGFTGIEKGSITHFVLQHLDFGRVGSVDEIKVQIFEMVEKELLKAEETEVVDVEGLLNFFRSDLGKRAISAPKVYREAPFNLVKKAREVISGIENCEEELLVQGVIDLYFEEQDGFVLVDYKTDYVSGENRDEIIKKYEVQVRLYQEALERIQCKKVKECFIYLLDSGEAIRL
jgi:ATP-dependent helicase/nuclease subunit A